MDPVPCHVGNGGSFHGLIREGFYFTTGKEQIWIFGIDNISTAQRQRMNWRRITRKWTVERTDGPEQDIVMQQKNFTELLPQFVPIRKSCHGIHEPP